MCFLPMFGFDNFALIPVYNVSTSSHGETIMTLTNQQIADYRANGYLIIRDVVSSQETSELRSVVQRMARVGAYRSSLKYPTPGKYTISGNRIAEPGLSPIAEHPAVVDAVESHTWATRSSDRVRRLSALPRRQRRRRSLRLQALAPRGFFNALALRHHPTKRFRPRIRPTARLARIAQTRASHRPRCAHLGPRAPRSRATARLHRSRAKSRRPAAMDMHTWHKAPGGTTSDDRVGIFNKYCAVNAPPAAGYYPYDRTAYDALSDNWQATNTPPLRPTDHRHPTAHRIDIRFRVAVFLD